MDFLFWSNFETKKTKNLPQARLFEMANIPVFRDMIYCLLWSLIELTPRSKLIGKLKIQKLSIRDLSVVHAEHSEFIINQEFH